MSHQGAEFLAAFKQHLPQMTALPEEELLRINVDLPTVIPRILGALPTLATLRPEMIRQLPEYDLSAVDNLRSLTLAMAHAHAASLMLSSPTEDIGALNTEGTELRELLLGDARNLARYKLLDGKRLDEVKSLVGYKNVAFDLIALAMLLRQNWPAVDGKTPTTLESLARAETIASQMLDILASRAQGEGDSDETTKLRQRAYTLFYRAYQETRRAVTFLRWNEGDLDAYCPSLFPRRGKRSGQEDEEGEEGEKAVAPVASPATPAAPVSPAAPVGPGLPGGSPFAG